LKLRILKITCGAYLIIGGEWPFIGIGSVPGYMPCTLGKDHVKPRMIAALGIATEMARGHWQKGCWARRRFTLKRAEAERAKLHL